VVEETTTVGLAVFVPATVLICFAVVALFFVGFFFGEPPPVEVAVIVHYNALYYWTKKKMSARLVEEQSRKSRVCDCCVKEGRDLMITITPHLLTS
jgi:hypothetical protein